MSGVFGIDVNKDCWEDITAAMGIGQPRGDEWGGFATIYGNDIRREADRGKITPLLERESLRLKDLQKIILHVIQSPRNPQPAKIDETPMGPIAVAFDGKIINREELMQKSSYLIGSEVGIMARIIGSGKDPIDGLKKVYENVKGPFCLLLLTMDGVFVARDTFGIRPLVLARFLEGDKIGCAVASESVCLEHIGMQLIRDVRPGEIISIEAGGFKVMEEMVPATNLVICGFEYGYWARPSSIIENVWVGEARRSAGRKLAAGAPDADIISSFPMSGNAAAEGLHQALGINYQSIFDFNLEAGGRSFLPYLSTDRAKRARNKLLIMPWAVKGKRIIIVDDSVVEGNQTLSRISAIRKAGAEEIHLRSETPPIIHSCPFDITPRGELIAANHSVNEIRKILGLDTLEFNTVENFVDSIISTQSEKRREENPITTKNICMGCFTGELPNY